MAQFDAIRIHDAQQRWLSQKPLCPDVVGGEQAKQARTVRQARKPTAVIATEPAIERTWSHPFERKQERQRHNLAGIELGLGMLGLISHALVYSTEQIDDKLVRRHAKRLLVCGQRPQGSPLRMSLSTIN